MRIGIPAVITIALLLSWTPRNCSEKSFQSVNSSALGIPAKASMTAGVVPTLEAGARRFHPPMRTMALSTPGLRSWTARKASWISVRP